MNYDDITLEVSDLTIRMSDDRRLGTFKVRVLQSPAGEMTPDQAASVEFNDSDLQMSLAKLDRRELDAAGLIAVGRTLAALLLPVDARGKAPSVREIFARSLLKAGPDGGLRLRLRLSADLAVIPWEYAYVERSGGEGINGFLALDPRIAIVRHEAFAASVTAPLLMGDIKVVTALAGAEGLPELDLDGEMKFLSEALRGLKGIELQLCQHATLKKLQPLLAGAGVFHFAGHGDFTRQMGARPGTYTGTGYLAFEDERVDAEQMGINLRGQGIRLAVLSGCHTGRRDGVSVWSGIAPALVKGEIPAVVANQFTILDKCAIAFSHQFYQALAAGMPIERAVSAGRIAVYNADKTGRDWGVPVLYLRAADGQLFGGAADPQARERAKQAVEADVKVRASAVKSGGVLVGAKVHRMLNGKLAVGVSVAGAVLGEVVGGDFERLDGGFANIQVDVGEVGRGGSLVGAKIGTLGLRSGEARRPSNLTKAAPGSKRAAAPIAKPAAAPISKSAAAPGSKNAAASGPKRAAPPGPKSAAAPGPKRAVGPGLKHAAAPGLKPAAALGRGVAPAAGQATRSKPFSISASVEVSSVTGGEVIGTQINRRQGDTIHGNLLKVARGGQASVNTGISGPVNITGPVTFIQGPTSLPPSAGPVLEAHEHTVEETVRLDVALPKGAVVNEPFDLVIAVMQPEAPKLAVADLDQVVSAEGSIFRSEDQDVVKYRVEVTGAGFDVTPTSYLLELRPGANSRPVAFQVTSSKTGRRSLLVNAYQEDGALAAQTRVSLAVVVAVSPG